MHIQLSYILYVHLYNYFFFSLNIKPFQMLKNTRSNKNRESIFVRTGVFYGCLSISNLATMARHNNYYCFLSNLEMNEMVCV